MKRILNFVISVLINSLLHIRWLLVPAVLCILHFALGLPAEWSLLALLVFAVAMILLTAIMYIAGNCRSLPGNDTGIVITPGRNRYFDELYGFRRK